MQTNQQNYGTYPDLPDQEDLEWKQAHTTMEDDFSPEQQMRIGFIRKVFGILSAQLLLTAFFIVLSSIMFFIFAKLFKFSKPDKKGIKPGTSKLKIPH